MVGAFLLGRHGVPPPTPRVSEPGRPPSFGRMLYRAASPPATSMCSVRLTGRESLPAWAGRVLGSRVRHLGLRIAVTSAHAVALRPPEGMNATRAQVRARERIGVADPDAAQERRGATHRAERIVRQLGPPLTGGSVAEGEEDVLVKAGEIRRRHRARDGWTRGGAGTVWQRCRVPADVLTFTQSTAEGDAKCNVASASASTPETRRTGRQNVADQCVGRVSAHVAPTPRTTVATPPAIHRRILVGLTSHITFDLLTLPSPVAHDRTRRQGPSTGVGGRARPVPEPPRAFRRQFVPEGEVETERWPRGTGRRDGAPVPRAASSSARGSPRSRASVVPGSVMDVVRGSARSERPTNSCVVTEGPTRGATYPAPPSSGQKYVGPSASAARDSAEKEPAPARLVT